MLFAVIAVVFVATLVRSTFGFGEALVAVPLLAIVMPLQIAVPLCVLVSILVALIVVVQDHRVIHIDSAKWLIVFALLGIPLGLWLLVSADPRWVKVVLGGVIIAYSAYALVAKQSLHLEQDHRAWLFACGLLSGVPGGAYGLNGPPLVIYGNLRRWSAQHFRATLQAYFLVTSIIGLAGYTAKGLVSGVVLRDFALSLPAVIPAVFLGRHFNRKLRGAMFFTYVHVGLLMIGIVLVALTLANVA